MEKDIKKKKVSDILNANEYKWICHRSMMLINHEDNPKEFCKGIDEHIESSEEYWKNTRGELRRIRNKLRSYFEANTKVL